jgi:hypothetical protein
MLSDMGSPGDLKLLIEQARRVEQTPAQREEQRRSFAYGNLKIENPRVTREMIDRVADQLPAAE